MMLLLKGTKKFRESLAAQSLSQVVYFFQKVTARLFPKFSNFIVFCLMMKILMNLAGIISLLAYAYY